MARASKPPKVLAQDLDRIIVRLPEGMRERLETFADANGRSMTAEVVAALEQHFAQPSLLIALSNKVNQLMRDMDWADKLIEELKFETNDLYQKLGADEPPYYTPRPSQSVENPPE